MELELFWGAKGLAAILEELAAEGKEPLRFICIVPREEGHVV